MSQALRRAVEYPLLTLWVGGMWVIGYLAVPILFATLDERMLAGLLAGQMFTAMSYIGLGAGAVLLLLALQGAVRPWSQWRVRLLLVMLVLVAVGEFMLQPMMAELKALGLAEGSDAAARFGMLHGVSAILYLLNGLCGLVLLLLYSQLRADG